VYFSIGPAASLAYGSEVSCGGVATVSILDINLGKADFSDNTCKAQRVAPFVLQLCFNIVFYAMVRVLLVVDERIKRMAQRTKTLLGWALGVYCAGIPIIFFIIAACLDKLSTDYVTAVGMLIRQATICTMRFPDASSEVVLVYLPFILTGTLVSFIALHIFTNIARMRGKVAGIKNKTKSDAALDALIMRLAFLGMSTFVVLIVLMVSTSVFSSEIYSFSSAWYAWFTCVVGSACALGNGCPVEYARAASKRPTVALMALQMASMSTITALFGLFFSAQSFNRLRAEYLDGTLRQKFATFFFSNRSGPTPSSRFAQDASGNGDGHRVSHNTSSAAQGVLAAYQYERNSSRASGSTC